MKILILEDSPKRMEVFFRYFNNSDTFNVNWCKTYNDFSKSLDKKYDIIILDHDLDDTDPYRTGLDASKLISNNHTNFVLIWSANTYGATKIEKELKNKNITTIKIPFIMSEFHKIKRTIEWFM